MPLNTVGSRLVTAIGKRVWARPVRLAVLALSAGLILLAVAAGPLMAAIELAYYRATSTPTSVLLEWATLSEYNVEGFEILCKRAVEPDTAYHPIGSRIAQGSPEQGATYSFNVTVGIFPGEAYCFRLREITTDETPGEQFALCGYGPGVTPVAQQGAVDPLLTPTPIVVEALPGLTPAPTLVTPGVILPAATPTPFPTPLDPFASPLQGPPPTPLGQATSVSPAGVQETQPSDANPFALPTVPVFPLPETPTALPTPELNPTATGTPVQDSPLVSTAETSPNLEDSLAAEASPPVAPTLVSEPSVGGGTGAEMDAAPADTPAAPAVAIAPETPTPIYMVVTATPTPEALAAAPLATFTPWPTPAATNAFALGDLLVPSTQNLMVMLLCLIFLSASGLGVLGLVTSVLYMRSQASRDRLPGPTYGRRRY